VRIAAKALRASLNKTFLLYLAAGLFNTLFTYALYLALLQLLSYRFAYTISYVTGLLLALLLQSRFVFKQSTTSMRAMLFGVSYLAQYLIGLAVIWTAVEQLAWPKQWALLAVIAINVPIGYVLSGLIFGVKNA
jgi:putative flippase GtrA